MTQNAAIFQGLNMGRPNTQSNIRAYTAAGMPRSLVVTLCMDELYKTAGDDDPTVAELYDIPELRHIGPMMKQIRVHYVCEGATANFRAKVSMSWSVLGRTWDTPVEIMANVTGSNTGTIGSWYTTDSEFGLLTRFFIEVSNSTGTAIESGRITVILEIDLKS